MQKGCRRTFVRTYARSKFVRWWTPPILFPVAIAIAGAVQCHARSRLTVRLLGWWALGYKCPCPACCGDQWLRCCVCSEQTNLWQASRSTLSHSFWTLFTCSFPLAKDSFVRSFVFAILSLTLPPNERNQPIVTSAIRNLVDWLAAHVTLLKVYFLSSRSLEQAQLIVPQ